METSINWSAPLAERMRPSTLDEFVGQSSVMAKDGFLRKALKEKNISSMIFWGPPGTGKTTLARLIAQEIGARFSQLSAVDSGVKDLRSIVESAEQFLRFGEKTILFIDEIHRWNKGQQDALLPYMEKGTIILLGATTENPSFALNSALLSRSQVLVLNRLLPEDLLEILKSAVKHKERGLGKLKLKIDEGTLEFLANLADGDARVALNLLAVASQYDRHLTIESIKTASQRKNLAYDKNGEEHYNLISALHKSMRGNDADAALYWLARMVEGGADPLYISRRLIRFASEDIGLANSTALLVANQVFDACSKIGLPECGVNLAQAVAYLAKSPKSVAVYAAYNKASQDARDHGSLPVPIHLRNAPTTFMKDLGYGKDYKYTPMEDSSEQSYFPDELKGKKYL
jgi:putative ATPase